MKASIIKGPEAKGPKAKGDLKLKLEGEAAPGQEVFLLVTSEDAPVENASITLDGEEVGVTDAEGRIALAIAQDATEAKIGATSGDLTGELEIEFGEATAVGKPDEGARDPVRVKGMEAGLELKLEGEVAPGQEVSLLVTAEGEPVENASVTLDEAEVGVTDAQGRITLTIPQDATEAKIGATSGDLTGELEIEFGEAGAVGKPDEGARDRVKVTGMEAGLELKLEGEVVPGQELSLLVTAEGEPVENASVTLDETEVGVTDAQGRITLTIPQDASMVKIAATSGDLTGELEIEFGEATAEGPSGAAPADQGVPGAKGDGKGGAPEEKGPPEGKGKPEGEGKGQ